MAKTKLQNEWIPFSSGWPYLEKYRYHTGKKVEVRYLDGEEEITIYQGHGLFGNGISMFKPVTHWRPIDGKD